MLDLETLQYFPDLGVSVARDDDKDKKDHWYVIPNTPTWHTRPDEKDPAKTVVDFSFVKVTRAGQITTTDQSDRAFFSFTTQLAPTQEMLNKLKSKLSATTFLTPWFTETKAALNIYAKPASATDSRVFVKSVANLLTPQRFGAALCPFQIELGEYGSPVMEALLTNAEDSGLHVGYEVKQLVKLPPSVITAEIKGEMVFQAVEKWANSKTPSIWGESDTSEGKKGEQPTGETPESFEAVIKQELSPSIEVKWVSNPFDRDTDAKARSSVLTWVFTLLEQHLRKFPDVATLMDNLRGKRPSDTGVKDTVLDMKKKLSIEGKGFRLSYKGQESVEYTWIASGALPSVGKLVPGVREKGEERRRYFLEVLANDPFFTQRPITVSFTDNVTKVTNARIEGSLSMPAVPGAGVVDFEKKQISQDFKFDANLSPIRVKLPLREDVDPKYREVTLDVHLNGTISGQTLNVHHRKTLTAEDSDRVDLTFAGIGLLQRTIDPTLLTFGTGQKDLRRVSVQCRFHTIAGKNPFARTFDFTKDKLASQELLFTLPKDAGEGALEYHVQYIYGDGTYRLPAGEGWKLFEADTLLILPFFRDETTEVLVSDFKSGSKDQVQIAMLYKSAVHQDSANFVLKATPPTENKKTVTLRTTREAPGLLSVSSTLIRENAKPIPLLVGEEYPLGPQLNLSVQQTLAVDLDLSKIAKEEWEKIDDLEVEVKMLTGGDARPRKFLIDARKFADNPATPVKTLRLVVSNPEEISVHWKAEFILMDDSTKRQEGDQTPSGDISEGITIQPNFRRAKLVKS